MNRPLLAITQGDPAGIGPEVIAASWQDEIAWQLSRRIVIGRLAVMQAALRLVGSTSKALLVNDLQSIPDSPQLMPVLQIDTDCDDSPPSQVSAKAGKAAAEAVTIATILALNHQVDGIVTAPLNKEALTAAGYDVPGHTELLARLCDVKNVAMMLYLPPRSKAIEDDIGLGVVHVTLHMALKSVFEQLTPTKIVDRCFLATRFAQALLQAAGVNRNPRIGVAALNPHAGEQGLFGDEEIRTIAPAVQEAQRRGYPVIGPLPCDTLMHRAASGEFDVVVAMYHDQGHIALKLMGLQRAVNVTLGLPIIRTSVAHGTAFDIAWKGRAQCGSMVEAIRVATKLSAHRDLLTWKSS